MPSARPDAASSRSSGARGKPLMPAQTAIVSRQWRRANAGWERFSR